MLRRGPYHQATSFTAILASSLTRQCHRKCPIPRKHNLTFSYRASECSACRFAAGSVPRCQWRALRLTCVALGLPSEDRDSVGSQECTQHCLSGTAELRSSQFRLNDCCEPCAEVICKRCSPLCSMSAKVVALATPRSRTFEGLSERPHLRLHMPYLWDSQAAEESGFEDLPALLHDPGH